MAQVSADVNGVSASLNRATVSSNAFNRSLLTSNVISWGKNIQWVGRQIEYSFTLPLVLAGAEALKLSNANQAAFTRLIKVYGDGSQSTKQIKTETLALQKAFIQLSDILGISQADITNIGADWAAAGASGLTLAKNTRITAEAMILGEMSAKDATESLIAISAQYKLNSKQLQDTVAILNAVENQTGTTFSGLIDAFTRSAGFAAVAGVSVRFLAADIAALTPAAGSAANAGNALKTIFSRILAPTKQASDLFAELGVNVNSAAWNSANAQQRLILLANATKNLTSGQRAVFDTFVAGRYQISRFSTLLGALVDQNSFYQKALDATSSKQKTAQLYTRELSTVLASQPQTFAILKTRLQNALVQGFTPLIPAIESLVGSIVVLANKFADLDPHTQKFILFALTALALFGPLLRYIGATVLLLGTLGDFLLKVGLFAVVGFRAAGVAVLGFAKILLTPFLLLFQALPKLVLGFAAFIGPAFSAIGTVAIAVFTGIGTALVGVWAGVVAAFEATTAVAGTSIAVFETAVATITPVIMTIGEALLAVWRGILAAIEALTIAWGTAFQALWVTIVTSIQILTAAWGEGFAVFWRALLTEIQLLTATWGKIFEFIWASLMTAITTITVAAGEALRLIWLGIVSFFGSAAVWGRAFTAVGAAVTGLGRVVLVGVATLGEALLPTVVAAITSPWTYAIGAVIALVIAFRRQIGEVFHHIGQSVLNAFNALPEGVKNAFVAVINVVRAAVRAVRSWLSDLNPFKRHSPSLVDNVKAGTHAIGKHYAGIGKAIKSPVGQAVDALGNLKSATAPANQALEQAGIIQQRAQVVALAPGAGGAYDAAASAMLRLEKTFPAAEAAIAKQQSVVDKWQASLDKANLALDAQNSKLKLLQDTANAYSDALDLSKTQLDKYANAPIQGMKLLDDQIFANTQQANVLQLAMAKLQQNAGVTDLAGQLSKVQGELEQLTGTEKSLRGLGAGSDILGPIQARAAALQAQAGALQGSANSYNQLAAQLAQVQQAGSILSLTKSVQFDPLTKQIQDLTNTAKELPFDQIVAGLKKWQPIVTANQTAFDNATEAVKRQQLVVDGLTSARDKVQVSYDAENAKLTALNSTYQANVDLVNKLKDAMSALSNAASSAAGKQSDAQAAFDAAGSGDFASGANSAFQLASDQGDQTSAINQLADQWKTEADKAFGHLDLFKPIKDMWKSFTKWINKETHGWAGRIVSDIVSGFKKIPDVFSGIGHGFQEAGHGITEFFTKNRVGKDIATWVAEAVRDIGGFFKMIGNFAKALYKLFGPDLAKIGHAIAGAFKPLGGLIKDVFSRLGPVLGNLWRAVKPLVEILGVALLGVLKVLSSVFANTLGPAIHGIIDVLKLIFDTFTDFINFIVDVFTLKWGKALKDIGQYFSDVFNGIKHIFQDVWNFLYGAIKGFVEGIVHFFQWLYDELVGHSIIPDLVNGIIWFFQLLFNVVKDIWNALGAVIQWVWSNVLLPIWNGFKWVWDNILYPTLQITLRVFTDVWKGIGATLQWVWNTLILPVFNLFRWAWDHILSPVLDAMKTGFALAWEGIGAVVDFAYHKVILPIYHALDDAWNNVIKKTLNALISGFYTIFNAVGDIVAIGINVAITALDALIGGVNWILKHIGVGSQITPIGKVPHPDAKAPQLAAAGAVLEPFKTNGIRAIVGEGNPNYPEYVIPTDPKFRARAQRLHEEAASRLFAAGGTLPNTTVEGGKTNITPYGVGTGQTKLGNDWGPLGSAADAVINGIKAGAGFIRKGAVIVALAPFLKAFDIANELTPKDVMGVNAKQWMNKEKNDFYNWAKGSKDTNREFGPNWEKNPPAGFKSWEDWANQGQFTGSLGGNAYQEIIQFARYGPAFSTALPGLDRGGHSYHESGNAIDFSGGNMDAMAEFWHQYKGYLLEEIHSPSWYVKNGKDVGAGFYGPDIVAQHFNHVHIAATKAAMDKLIASKMNPGLVGVSGGTAIADEQIGRAMAAAMGWTGGQWDALDQLWAHESGWLWNVGNSSSGAYGIPQALPANKMASAGADWYTNPATQIRWGLGYIKDVYGNPENAWNAWLSRGGSPFGNWYMGGGKLPTYPALAAGGIVKASPGGTLVRVGEGGRDEKIIPLPSNETNSKGDIHFHGDLSFPNIKSGNDAHEFIQNLKVLAKK